MKAVYIILAGIIGLTMALPVTEETSELSFDKRACDPSCNCCVSTYPFRSREKEKV
jgi:hypothetical protein